MGNIAPIPKQPVSDFTLREVVNQILENSFAVPQLKTGAPTVLATLASPGPNLNLNEDFIVLDFGATPVDLYVDKPETFVLYEDNSSGNRLKAGVNLIDVTEVWSGNRISYDSGLSGGGGKVFSIPPGNLPIMPGTVVIWSGNGGVLAGNGYDDGLGNFAGGITGTINYATGAVNITALNPGVGNTVRVGFVGNALRLDNLGPEFYTVTKVILKTNYVIPSTTTVPVFSGGTPVAAPPLYTTARISYGAKSAFRLFPTDVFIRLGSSSPANPSDVQTEIARTKGIDPAVATAVWNSTPPLGGTSNKPLANPVPPNPSWYHLPEVHDRVNHLIDDNSGGAFQSDHYDPGSAGSYWPPVVTSQGAGPEPTRIQGRHRSVRHWYPDASAARIRLTQMMDPAAPPATLDFYEEYAGVNVGNQYWMMRGNNANLSLLGPQLGGVSRINADLIRREVSDPAIGGLIEERTHGRTAGVGGEAWRLWFYNNAGTQGWAPAIQAFYNPNGGAGGSPANQDQFQVWVGTPGDVVSLPANPVSPVFKYFRPAAGAGSIGFNGNDEVATVGYVQSSIVAASNAIPYQGIALNTPTGNLAGNFGGTPTNFFGFNVNPAAATTEAGIPYRSGFYVRPNANWVGGVNNLALMRLSNAGVTTDTASRLLKIDASGLTAAGLTAQEILMSGAGFTPGTHIGLKIGVPAGRAVQIDDGEFYFQGLGGGDSVVMRRLAANYMLLAQSAGWTTGQHMTGVFASIFNAAGLALMNIQANTVGAGANQSLLNLSGGSSAWSGSGGAGLRISVGGTGNPRGIISNAPIQLTGAALDQQILYGLPSTPATVIADYTSLTGTYPGLAASKEYVDAKIAAIPAVSGYVEVGSAGTPSSQNVWNQITLADPTNVFNTSWIKGTSRYQQLNLTGPNDGTAAAVFATDTDLYDVTEVTGAAPSVRFNTNATYHDGFLATKGMVRGRLKLRNWTITTGAMKDQFVASNVYFQEVAGTDPINNRTSKLKMSANYNDALKKTITGAAGQFTDTDVAQFVATKGYVDEAIKPKVLGSYAVALSISSACPPMVSVVAGDDDLPPDGGYNVGNEDVQGYGCDIAAAVWPTNIVFDRTTESSSSTDNPKRGNWAIGTMTSHNDLPFRHVYASSQGYIPGQSINKRDRGGQINGISSITSITQRKRRDPLEGTEDSFSSSFPVRVNINPDQAQEPPSGQDGGAIARTNWNTDNSIHTFPADLTNQFDRSAFITMWSKATILGLVQDNSFTRPILHLRVEKQDVMGLYMRRDNSNSYIYLRPQLKFVVLNCEIPAGSAIDYEMRFFVLRMNHAVNNGVVPTTHGLSLSAMIPN